MSDFLGFSRLGNLVGLKPCQCSERTFISHYSCILRVRIKGLKNYGIGSFVKSTIDVRRDQLKASPTTDWQIFIPPFLHFLLFLLIGLLGKLPLASLKEYVKSFVKTLKSFPLLWCIAN